MRIVLLGLSPRVIEDVAEQGELILIRAPDTVGDGGVPGLWSAVAAGARLSRTGGRRCAGRCPPDVLRVTVRRLVCPTRGRRQTFREQVPGVLERYQRRTLRLAGQIGAAVKVLAGRAGARLLSA